jgi:tRNA(fMet)-specific endonuclease VapC
MIHMLDTDTMSYLIKGQAKVEAKYRAIGSDSICLSVISEGEIWSGVSKNSPGQTKLTRMQLILESLSILPITSDVAKTYGKLRSQLEKDGQPIGPNDTWIAAHALSLGATLVTNNVREFKRVKGLKVENWAL